MYVLNDKSGKLSESYLGLLNFSYLFFFHSSPFLYILHVRTVNDQLPFFVGTHV